MEQEYKWKLPDELEFEYLDGSSSLFYTFAAELEHTFHLEKQLLSKLARALAV